MWHRLRCIVAGLALAAPLLLSACSDNPTEITAPAIEPARPLASVALGCQPDPTAASLLTMINGLLPRSPLRTSLIALVNALPKRFQDRIKLVVRRLIFPIQDLVFRLYYAGRLSGGTSPETFDKVLRFSEALHCYVGLTPPSYPSQTAGQDVVVGVVFTNSPTTTLVTPTEQAAVQIPQGAAPEATTIVIRKLPDSPGPLLTSLNQYPFFYEYSGTTATGAPVTFNIDVTAAICLKDNLEGVPTGNLRLAHNVAPFAFGDVEVLPLSTSLPGINCDDLPQVGFLRSSILEPLGRALLPQPLHATGLALATTGVGGTTKKFSPFGVVDIFSNPGSFSAVSPTTSSETGGTTVTRTVRVRSKNTVPIANVPVTFSTAEGNGTVVTPQPVFTNGNGEATASWTLPTASDTYELTASVPAEDNAPTGTSNPPAGSVLSIPDVAFTPQSITFTATVGPVADLSIDSGDGQDGFADQILTAPLVVFASQNESPVQGVTVTWQVTSGGGTITPSSETDENGLAVATWTLGPDLGEQTATAGVPGGEPLAFTANAQEAPPARIVLQWGAQPSDLDAHLTGPLPEDRFHVFFFSRGNLTSSPFAALDRDDVDSFGPETITISQLTDGLYRFSVHDFSNRLSSSSTALGASGATATLYLASSPTPQVFTVPNDPGTLWTVFEMTVSDGGAVVTPKNTMGFTSDPVGGPFLRLDPSGPPDNDAVMIRESTRERRK